MKLKNPLLKEIKSHYMMAYMMAVTACEVLEAHYHQHIQEDEIGYFALSLNLALERKKTGISKKNILVVCATGRGSAQLLMYQLKREFGKYLNSAETCDVMELKDFDLTLIDYVITTVSIPFSISRPILEISLFLNYKDENRIQTLLTGKADRTLEGYFQPELFMSELEAGSKQEILEAMVERIHRVRKVPENFLEAVLERERMGITSFGNMVAIPHPNYPLTDETFVCVAILKNPMYWDKQKVQVVFMLSMGKNGTEDVQYFSSILSRMLFSTEYISEMIKKPEYSGMLQRLEKIEREMKENNG